jgi:hypothetical protein
VLGAVSPIDQRYLRFFASRIVQPVLPTDTPTAAR